MGRLYIYTYEFTITHQQFIVGKDTIPIGSMELVYLSTFTNPMGILWAKTLVVYGFLGDLSTQLRGDDDKLL